MFIFMIIKLNTTVKNRFIWTLSHMTHLLALAVKFGVTLSREGSFTLSREGSFYLEQGGIILPCCMTWGLKFCGFILMTAILSKNFFYEKLGVQRIYLTCVPEEKSRPRQACCYIWTNIWIISTNWWSMSNLVEISPEEEHVKILCINNDGR